jgi:hypothetical protein
MVGTMRFEWVLFNSRTRPLASFYLRASATLRRIEPWGAHGRQQSFIAKYAFLRSEEKMVGPSGRF